MKKKLLLIVIICLGAVAIWNGLQHHHGLELKIGYSNTTEVTDQDKDSQDDEEDQEDSEIYDIFGNQLD